VEAAFFDLDKTVIAKASVVAFGSPFYKEGLISRRTILRGLWGQLVYLHLGAGEEKIVKMRTAVLALTKGWDQARVQAIVEEALEAVVEPIIYGEALELMTRHRADGRLIVIVSASPEEIVLPLARYLGVDEAIASRAAVDGAGRYTGRMQFDAFGPAKVEAMKAIAGRRGVNLTDSFAYSDSATDLPMLEAVGHPVAVNADRELARVAAERGWETRVFDRPVKIESRGGRVTSTAVAGVAVLAVAGGGAVWWSRHHRVPGWLPAPRRPGTATPGFAAGAGIPGFAAGASRGWTALTDRAATAASGALGVASRGGARAADRTVGRRPRISRP
jgi:HAD superfamily hydrolase (TIGR01490 family)